MSDLTIYKDNNVINASYRLTLNEQRLILSCIGKIQSDQPIDEQMHFSISVGEYAQLFNITPKRAYYDLREVVERLFDRFIVIDAKSIPDSFKEKIKIYDGKFKTRWISYIAYSNDEKKFPSDLRP
nr:RepB family plasmid replication initiator protein [Methylomarinum sp. Ch1-1]MDP4523238.1 RepB family plasmid replication initiator protein [Methylomarinum sp. Ch1-1]